MSIDRRAFVVGGLATLGLAATPSAASDAMRPAIKVIAFDAFPIFNPAPVAALAERLFPGKGAELTNQWRTRQFEYTWLRSLSRHYADFWQVTSDSLVFAAKALKLEMTPDARNQLLQSYLALEVWPDVAPALKSLREAGLRLAFLSNFTTHMLQANLKHSGLSDLFEHVISADKARIYKPAPAAYQLGIDAFHLKREEILFVAHAGWDAAGARLFGYPTLWINRMHAPVEELDVAPDATGASLDDLIKFVQRN